MCLRSLKYERVANMKMFCFCFVMFEYKNFPFSFFNLKFLDDGGEEFKLLLSMFIIDVVGDSNLF